jgi:hypothetical protein
MSRSQHTPSLTAVPQPPASEPVEQDSAAELGTTTLQPASQPPTRGAGKMVSWALAAALVICALFLLQQLRRAELLAGQVASMRSELEGARDRLVLYEGRMVEVRLSVSELLGQVAGLRDLVNESLPGEAPPSQPERGDTPAREPSAPQGTTLPGAEDRPAARL